MTNCVRPRSQTNRTIWGGFSTPEDTAGTASIFSRVPGPAPGGELAVKTSQAKLEDIFKREGAGEPNSHPPGVSGDHRADRKQLEPDRAHLSARPEAFCFSSIVSARS